MKTACCTARGRFSIPRTRKVCEWEFDHGERSGKSVWYYPNGLKRREVDYRQGDIDGEVVEYSADQPQKVALREKYVDGRRLAAQVDNYAPGQKRAEGWILYAKENTKSNYDFWNGIAAIQVVGTEGQNQRHGLWTWWHKNGQKQMEGRYEADLPVGKFTWWYPNGQKQLQGEYIAGKQTRQIHLVASQRSEAVGRRLRRRRADRKVDPLERRRPRGRSGRLHRRRQAIGLGTQTAAQRR